MNKFYGIKQLKPIAFLLALIVLSACGVSEEEKEERQANAFDISGGWMTSDNLGIPSSGVQDDVTLFITNEGVERSNIKVEIIRDAWSSQEENFFAQLPISYSDKEKLRSKFDGTFEIGSGRHNEHQGGENISDDFGESTKLSLSTHGNEVAHLSNGYEVNYFLEGTIQRNDFVLRGKLRIIVTRTKAEVDAAGNTTYFFENIGNLVLNFDAKNKTVYYQQYFGTWSGKAELSTDYIENILDLSQIELRQYDSEIFSLRPNIRRLIYRGEIFELQSKYYDLLELKLVRFPTLDFTFMGDRGSIIHFGGSVRSLGHFSGSIEYITQNTVDTIGFFDFKRL